VSTEEVVQAGRCGYCGVRFYDGDAVRQPVRVCVIPPSKGGCAHAENIALVCIACKDACYGERPSEHHLSALEWWAGFPWEESGQPSDVSRHAVGGWQTAGRQGALERCAYLESRARWHMQGCVETGRRTSKRDL
jgi:hypothetical protein